VQHGGGCPSGYELDGCIFAAAGHLMRGAGDWFGSNIPLVRVSACVHFLMAEDTGAADDQVSLTVNMPWWCCLACHWCVKSCMGAG
jgi:hypothetical protein